jgi:curli biogenesis system outer membrane secretion channel CsgG
MPPANHPVRVSVYDIKDQTGQHKPNDAFAEYSRAVTQAGDAILIDVLKKAGGGRWFRVMERAQLKNLLQERNIIDVNAELRLKKHLQSQLRTASSREHDAEVLGARHRLASIKNELAEVSGRLAALQSQANAPPQGSAAPPPAIAQEFQRLRTRAQQLQEDATRSQKELDRVLDKTDHRVAEAQQEVALVKAAQELARERVRKAPPLRTAAYVVEGAITGYDSNEITGGLGARYLGIGGDKQYRRDIATVTLRLVDVKSGEICLSVTSTKTIYSIALRANAFKFVAIDKILEAEGGVSRNEPPSLAVRHAFELAVFSLIAEGAKQGLWRFASPEDQQRMIDHYEGRYTEPRNNPRLIARRQDLVEF